MKKTKLYLILSVFSLAPLAANANSLMDVYQSALKNDAQMKADQASYQAGKEYSTIARAGLLPQINAKASYSKDNFDSTNNLTSVTSNSDTTTKGWNISLTQQLFNMNSWYVYKQGVSLSDQAEAQYSADQQNLIVRVATAYFNVLRAAASLEATKAEEQALAQQLEQAKQRFDVGLTAITDVHEAQAAYDSATAATLEARGLLGIAYEALEVLTGQAEDSIAPLSDKFPVVAPTPANRADWVEFALKNNYNLKAARLGADAARQNAKASKSNHLPTLSAALGYSDTTQDGTIGAAYDQTNKGSSASLTLNVPLFSGGATTGRSRQAAAQYAAAEEGYNSTQRNVIQNARSLHLSVETDVARVQARKQAIISSQSALDATKSGYEVGTRNFVEVLLAQRNLYQARRNYYQALFDYVIDGFKLREVAGMLTPNDVQEVEKWLNSQAPVSRSHYER